MHVYKIKVRTLLNHKCVAVLKYFLRWRQNKTTDCQNSNWKINFAISRDPFVASLIGCAAFSYMEVVFSVWLQLHLHAGRGKREKLAF